MPQFDPEVLISRHVEKLLARPDKDRVDELLRCAQLVRAGDKVIHPRGTVMAESCYQYKQLVRQLYGDAVYGGSDFAAHCGTTAAATDEVLRKERLAAGVTPRRWRHPEEEWAVARSRAATGSAKVRRRVCDVTSWSCGV